MKFFGVDISRKRIFRALFGWSLVLPSKTEPTKQPSEIAIEDEECFAPLSIAEDSILRATDPLLMTKRERYENTVRYWMERKGYDKKEVEKPLTDERMKEIGRTPFYVYSARQAANREAVFTKYPQMKAMHESFGDEI